VSERGSSSCVRLLLVGSIVALLAAAFIACDSDAVIIGIDGDGGPATPLATPVNPPPPAVPNLDSGASLVGPGDLDGSFIDADMGPCLPDAGCPVGSACEYSVEAGCGAPGECFSPWGPVQPPPPPPPPPGMLPLGGAGNGGARPLVDGYQPTPITCDAGSLSTAHDAGPADAHAD
jgi:hypothetical protein